MICDRLRANAYAIDKVLEERGVGVGLRAVILAELTGLARRVEALEGVVVPAAARDAPDDVISLAAERARRYGGRPRPRPSGGDAA